MFVCLFLPNFRLQSALRWREVSVAAAVVDPESGLLLELNAAGLDQGIRVGVTGLQAMARDAGILLLPPAPAQEDCLTQLLAAKAMSLSPAGENTAPGVVIADLRNAAPSLCWQQLADGLVTQFRTESLDLVVGVAPTPDLALVAARGARPTAVVYDGAAFVAPLSIDVLELSPSLHQTLRDWGISTVGEFLRLPREDSIDRLGPEATTILRRVSGRHKRLLKLIRTRPDYRAAFDFEYEVTTVEPLLFLLRRFLDELCVRLRDDGRVVRSLSLTLLLDDGTKHRRSFGIPDPTAEVDTLFRILHTHLETLQLPQQPVGIRMKLEETGPSRDQLRLLESALRDPNRFGETLARLKAMVGNDGVGVPVPDDTHEPDRFSLRETFASAVADKTRETSPQPSFRGLPLRRYRPGATCRVTLQDGAPVSLTSPVASGRIDRCRGPFRLSGHWWEKPRWAIEEWDIVLAGGSLYRLACRERTWTVEGCYEVC